MAWQTVFPLTAISKEIRARGLEDLQISIDQVVHDLCSYLDMEFGFITEFFENHRSIRFASSQGTSPLFRVGDSIPLGEGYCKAIIDGVIPELMRDASTIPAAAAKRETAILPIGAHVGVPIRLPSGELFGTVCCFRRTADPSLSERDLGVVKAVAEFIGRHLAKDFANNVLQPELRDEVRSAIGKREPIMALQPILSMKSGREVGYEALARFPLCTKRSTLEWFHVAASVGLGMELEIMAITNAIQALDLIPQSRFLSLNCSPEVLKSKELIEVLDSVAGASRIVLELTEQAIVKDFSELTGLVDKLRLLGVRIAMDDAGAGFSSLQHLILLRPEIIKLDMSIAYAVEANLTAQAMVKALVSFADQIGSVVVAEGVETEAVAEAFRNYGVHAAQGFLYGKPMLVDCIGFQGDSEQSLSGTHA